jgi:hypothetical protein
MTPEQHNKYLAMAHAGYGAFFLLMLTAMGALFFAVIMSDPQMGNAGSDVLFLFIVLFFGVFYSAMILPSFIAAYALFKRKKWARVASIVAGVFAGMSFPFGTAVCIYTFWFLFSEPGKFLYDKPAPALPPPPPTWAPEQVSEPRQQSYALREKPPDWR